MLIVGASTLLSGCADGRTRTPIGQIDVTVTLSRNVGGGGLGPSLDHVPQSLKTVTVVGAAGEKLTAATDSHGLAQLQVPPGEYDVSADFCPNGPEHVVVASGATVNLSIDCLAP